MARKAKKKSKGRSPTPKAKKAYYKNIIKSYKRLEGVVAKYQPDQLVRRK